MLWILRRIHVAIMRPVAHREWYRSGPSTIRGAGLQGRKPTIHLNGIGSAAFSLVGQRLRGAVSPRACVALGSVEQRLGEAVSAAAACVAFGQIGQAQRAAVSPQRRAWRLARSNSGW
ncbi:MAG: hypothetical protein KatS3mg055_1340 [Chloroflexus sp.]|uniref:hypothetical protein n=1 Tax=Chloroflexus sp. TaxID=1904827 RepID=UPI0021DDAAEE|nr:hypothetical protein [Chloroflexus sp.]GIV88822.1 MAG: hypothetical protein KatS3mg055_1340 [Chloroflexus sp.]